jgi:hypothetical protein
LLLKFEREKKDLDAGEKTTEKKKQNIKKIKRTNNINDNSEKKKSSLATCARLFTLVEVLKI